MALHRADIHPPEALFDMTLPVFAHHYAQRFLAAGDSWFSLSQVPSSSLLFGLRFAKSALIINCATPGATISNMIDWRRNRQFESLAGPGGPVRWPGILVSSGGNDLINAIDHLLLPFAAGDHDINEAGVVDNLIDAAGFQRFETYLRQNYADLIALRDAPGSPNQGVPVYAHTYDYATPREARATFLGMPAFGPWLAPAMRRKNIPQSLWIALSCALQDRNAAILLSLNLPQLQVIDTRGMLAPASLRASGLSGDWSKEIHPSGAGYRKLAARWNEVLRQA